MNFNLKLEKLLSWGEIYYSCTASVQIKNDLYNAFIKKKHI